MKVVHIDFCANSLTFRIAGIRKVINNMDFTKLKYIMIVYSAQKLFKKIGNDIRHEGLKFL